MSRLNLSHISFVFLSGIMILLSGCLKDECEAMRTYVEQVPVYKTLQEIRTSAELESPRSLKQPGKIYFYNHYIFVNEMREGIHVIDNKEPSNPQIIAFLAIPGNVDIAIQDSYLYADNYTDLLTFDISNPAAPRFLSRVEEVFPSLGFDPNLGHLMYYSATERTIEEPCNSSPWFWRGGVLWAAQDAAGSFNRTVNQTAGVFQAKGTGIGGSLARFTIADNYLYTVSISDMKVFSLKSPETPAISNTVNIGWGIETIFPHEQYFFIGSNNGMFIFDRSNPLKPYQIAQFAHARACDPVYVDGTYAYVTLRDGTECESFSNQLDVVDISTITAPSLVKSFQLHHPAGLSMAGKDLYICDDDQGVKVFDTSDKLKITDNLLAHLKGFRAYDIITLPSIHLAMVIGEDGLHQFDISDVKNIKQLSVINVAK